MHVNAHKSTCTLKALHSVVTKKYQHKIVIELQITQFILRMIFFLHSLFLRRHIRSMLFESAQCKKQFQLPRHKVYSIGQTNNIVKHSSDAATQRCSIKKYVFLKISQNSQENTCVRVSFFNKKCRLRPAALLKKRPWHSCLPVKFAKYLRTHFLHNTSG